MTDVVIFSDSAMVDHDDIVGTNILNLLPAKSAGPYRIATDIRNAGFTCQVISHFFYFSLEEIKEVCQKFINNETLVVGFSTTFWYDVGVNEVKKELFKYVYSYAKKLNNVKIIFGGASAAGFADKVQADASFDGFSEHEFTRYVRGLKQPTQHVESEFNFSKSKITYQDVDCIDFGESVVIEVGRGCIFKCSFCCFPLNGKNKYDYIKEADTLKEELIYNYEKYGITNYTLSDDTFNDSTYKIDYLYKLFSELPFKIKFVSYLRLDLLNAHREHIQMLKEMGLVGAFFGIETLNRKAGQLIGKGIAPNKVKDFLYELKSEYWKEDVNITVGIISGLPYETNESHKEIVDWILDEKYCLVDRIRPAALSCPNPLLDRSPYKSEFQLNASRYGFYWPDPKSNFWKNYNHDVKSREQAVAMAKEIYSAAESVGKITKGNFGLMTMHNIGRYAMEPKNLNDIMMMTRFQYKEWIKNNKEYMCKSFVDNYKKRLTNL